MATEYDRIGEPLNLMAAGQRWFTDAYHRHYEPKADGNCVVLGAVSWLAALVRREHHHTIVVDSSPQMLARCAPVTMVPEGDVDFVQCNWLMLPAVPPLRLAVGDNSFSFLRFPDEWRMLANVLAVRMEPGAVILSRICSVPPHHSRRGTPSIAADAEHVGSALNCTEVRARLLFDGWDRDTASIRTEAVLAEFEHHRERWREVMTACDVPSVNDLISIRKYRGTGATYYAPRLDDALAALADRFRVIDVQYGPYAMSDYFPLLCLERR